MSILILLPIFVIGYFLLIRPQQQQARRQRDLVSSLRMGAEVQTAGGIVGRIVDLDDQFVQLHVGPNTTITFVRSAVQKVISLPDAGPIDVAAEPGDPPYGADPIDLSEPSPGTEPIEHDSTEHESTQTVEEAGRGPTGDASPGPVFGGSEDQAGQPTQALPVNPPSDPAPPPTWAPGSGEAGDRDAPA